MTSAYALDHAVATNGADSLVVWQGIVTKDDVFGPIVRTDGGVVGLPSLAISTGPEDQRSPAVASDGSNFLVVWLDCRGIPSGCSEPSPGVGANLYAARVSATGLVLDPGGIAVATLPGTKRSPTIEFGGGVFLVTWFRENPDGGTGDLRATRITPAGAVLDPDGISLLARPCVTQSATAFNGAAFVTEWTGCAQGNMDVRISRMTPAGVVLEDGGLPVETAPGDQFAGGIGCRPGGECLATWSDRRNIEFKILRGARIDPAGTRLDPAGVELAYPTDLNPSRAWVTANDAGYLLGWDQRVDRVEQAFGTPVVNFFSPSLQPEVEVPLATGTAYSCGQPIVAGGAGQYLVLWNEHPTQAGWARLRAMRLDVAGQPIDSTDGVELGPRVGRLGAAAAVPGGYQLAWVDGASNNLTAWSLQRSRRRARSSR